MSDYSYQDVLRMQEEAKARVMEMQRRSRFLAEDFAGREARAESGETRAESGKRRAEIRTEERNEELSRGAEPEGSSEAGGRNSEFGGSHRREPRCYEPPGDRARAIRMPVEWPESGSEFGARSSELRQGMETVGAVSAAAVDPVAGKAVRQNAARESNGLSAALRRVFGNMGEEETEKMFLLALCLLLHQENGDEGLMMAMMYLLT